LTEIRRGETKALRVVMRMNVEKKRRRGRPKRKRLLDTIENDMRAVGVWLGDVQN